ncbi:MAG: 2-phosphosulfolactate phosphatase [Firmicutes bacterium]|nr:2-phosphosulfolactate phosphatase [Bacillota bacterium]
MKLSVYALPTLVPPGSQGPAVVIDVLRATSVMVTALAHGAAAITAVEEIEDARSLAASYPTDSVLLGGERQALPIPGFDLSNSPREYTPEKVKDKHIILTTTNGTRALASLAGIEPLFIGAFLNASAVAKTLAALGQDAMLVCAGTRGRFTLDDISCAGLIAAQLSRLIPNLELDDLAYTAYFLYQSHAQNIKHLVSHAQHFSYLQSIGLEADINYCLQVDALDLVPKVQEGTVVLQHLK